MKKKSICMNINGYDIAPGADLQEANLWGANLQGVDLQEGDLRGANLRVANLRGANLQGADLSKAIICDTNFDEALISYRNKVVRIKFKEV